MCFMLRKELTRRWRSNVRGEANPPEISLTRNPPLIVSWGLGNLYRPGERWPRAYRAARDENAPVFRCALRKRRDAGRYIAADHISARRAGHNGPLAIWIRKPVRLQYPRAFRCRV